MPTELEELVEFLHHGNTQIRQIAAENLVPYSKVEPGIFKSNSFKPVKDLKLLVRDYAPIARNALTILINISNDGKVLKSLAEDDAFLETVLGRVTDSKEPTANDLSMLLANLSKSPSIARLITTKRPIVPDLSPSPLAITQLLELYNRGANGGYNKSAHFDYLAYVFADLAKFDPFVTYLTTPPPTSSLSTTLDPLTTILPHTTSPTPIRRLGTASLLKNHALLHPDIPYLLQPAHSLLPPLLLPLCNSDQSGISEEEMEQLPEECQYLDGSHMQERDVEILKTHLETLFLLSTRGGSVGRGLVKEAGTYPVIRELHLHVEDEGVRGACERLVDVLMGEEAGVEGHSTGFEGRRAVEGAKGGEGEGRMVTQKDVQEEEDEDNEIVPIF
ncbi:hypothetical protein MMC28_010552 [Mycoblastus sanguinarius]|nr:hypothetical protein [Mycoblastus sanguinarius]